MTSSPPRRRLPRIVIVVTALVGLFAFATVDADATTTPPAPPAGYNVVLSESWPGTAWSNAWHTSTASGAFADVAAGQGRMTVDQASSWVRTTATGATATKDQELLTSYQWNSTAASAYLNVFVRGSGGWQNAYRPMSGYGLEMASNSALVTVVKTVAGARTVLGTAANGNTKTTGRQWLRFRAVGQQVMFRTWPDGQAEPTTWAYSGTDSSVSAAGQAFASLVRGGSNVGAKSVSLDDLVLSSPTAVPAAAPAWRLLWSDEFDGTSVKPEWQAYDNTYGEGNAELQCLTPSNVRVSAGTLKIDARREQVTCPGNKVRQFTSGFLGTRETGTYFPRFARYEMRAKLPHAQGIWPGFWLRHRDGAGTAEVDIMEYFHAWVPGKTTSTLHLDGRANLSKKVAFVENPSTTPGWHTWAVEIEPSGADVKFTFLIDDVIIHTYTDTQHLWANADPLRTWDIAVNMSVGGTWNGHPDDALGYIRGRNTCSLGGTAPNGCTSTGIRRATFPVTYELDYVRVLTR